MSTQTEVAAILDGWTVTLCADQGAYWTIAGIDPSGRSHAGSRADPIELAHDLARAAELRIVVTPTPWTAPAPEPIVLSVPDPAPQDIAPPAAEVFPAADVVGGAIDAYPGLFLQRDDKARLRADLMDSITEIEERRLEASGDVNKIADALQAISDWHNANSQTRTDEIKRRYNEAILYQNRETLIRAHAAKLRAAARKHDLPMLQAMIETHEEGWP
jgi:hypothetical protein